MKLVTALAFGLAAVSAMGQQARSVRLLSQLSLPTLGASSGSGCSGYVSKSGREYAVIGLDTGYNVVDITKPTKPKIISHIGGVISLWHEVVVKGDFAFTCTEGGGGMQVIDLRQADQGTVSLLTTYASNGYSTGHTIQASPSGPYVYIHGAQPTPGGIIALDVSDPAKPVEVGRWSERYVHDAQYVTYTSGPYAGKEIAFACCGGDGLYILDVTNKAAITKLGFIKYLANGGYCHSGSLTEDKKFFLVNDEFDEANGLFETASTHVINVQDLANPTYVTRFTNGVPVIDHNSMIQDGHRMLASYDAGLRVARVRFDGTLRETGYYDTLPDRNDIEFAGSWGVFAGFPSGNAIISDLDGGLFVLDPSEAKGMGAPVISASQGGRSLGETMPEKVRKTDAVFASVTTSGWRPTTINFTLDSNETEWTGWDFSLRLRTRTAVTGTVKAFLKNQTNGQYEPVGDGTFNGAWTVLSVSGTGKQYADANGRIDVRLTLNGPLATPTTVDLDLVRVILR